jgi:hypothetical protein
VIAQVPELWDGGWWYIVAAEVSEEGTTVPLESSWCANYGTVDGVVYGIVRKIDDAIVAVVDVTFAEVIAAAVAEGSLPETAKFYARLGGV